MSSSTQPSSSPDLSLEKFLASDATAQGVLEAAKKWLDELRDYGFVRIYAPPVFEDLIAAAQAQITFENNDIKAIIDIFPYVEPDDDSPLMSINIRTKKRRGPTLEIYPAPPRVENGKVIFWVKDANPSAVVVKLLEEKFLIRDEYKVFSVVASYAAEENPTEGLTSLIIESLELGNVVAKDITFSLFKWKSLPLCYSVAYTAVPFFLGLHGNPEKVCNVLRTSGVDVETSTTIKDLMRDQDMMIETIKILVNHLSNVSKRERDATEIIYEGVELTEEAAEERNLPKILIHGFRQGSFVFLGVTDLGPYHVASLPVLSYHFYRAEELYIKNIKFAKDELTTALVNPKLISVGGRKVTVLSMTQLPPSPTLTYRMVRDLGYAREPAHVVAFVAENTTAVPLDSIKRAGLDLERFVRRALERDWKIEGGSLVVKDERGKKLKELLEA